MKHKSGALSLRSGIGSATCDERYLLFCFLWQQRVASGFSSFKTVHYLHREDHMHSTNVHSGTDYIADRLRWPVKMWTVKMWLALVFSCHDFVWEWVCRHSLYACWCIAFISDNLLVEVLINFHACIVFQKRHASHDKVRCPWGNSSSILLVEGFHKFHAWLQKVSVGNT